MAMADSPSPPDRALTTAHSCHNPTSLQTAENTKNKSSRSSRVLTQGDKLNLIKARKFQQSSKTGLVEGKGENLESSPIHGLESLPAKGTKTKTSVEGKVKLNSVRAAKPSILPKREGSRTNSR